MTDFLAGFIAANKLEHVMTFSTALVRRANGHYQEKDVEASVIFTPSGTVRIITHVRMVGDGVVTIESVCRGKTEAVLSSLAQLSLAAALAAPLVIGSGDAVQVTATEGVEIVLLAGVLLRHVRDDLR
jgi:hypothetical protein